MAYFGGSFESLNFLYCPIVNCKATLCTVELDNVFQKFSPSLPSLIRLCCRQIIKYTNFFDISRLYFPRSLYNVFLMEAVSQDLRDTAEFLLSTWPTKILSIMDLVPYPQGFSNGSTKGFRFMLPQMFYEYSLNSYLMNSLKAVVFVLRLFLEIVRKKLTPKLRVLNLSGWVLNEYTMKLLCREIANLLNDDIQLLDDYHIVIECKIWPIATYIELMSLLRSIHKSQRAKIHLHFKKLEISNLRRSDLWQLLQNIDSTELIGLKMSNFPIDFMEQVFAEVPSLTALVIIQDSSSQTQMLPLHLLPRLRRLELACFNNGFSTRIPESSLRQLEHLYISGRTESSVIENDCRFLISVPLNLRELFLSGLDIRSTHLHLWRQLALLVAPTLKILILRNCLKNDTNFATIVSFILPLINLVHLDLLFYKTSAKSLYQCLPELRSMPQLKKIVLACPYYEDDYSSEIDVARIMKVTCEDIARMMASGKSNPIEIEWHNNN